MTTADQQIAENTVDRVINLHAANPNRSREWLAEAVGLREAVEKIERTLMSLRRRGLPADADELYAALAALKGET